MITLISNSECAALSWNVRTNSLVTESKATEFAEYMAKAAEQYMTEVAGCWDLGDELTESMLDELKDKTVALQRTIYEFRKRVPNAMLKGVARTPDFKQPQRLTAQRPFEQLVRLGDKNGMS
ncbi:MAG: hypothetical protein Q7U57_09560 [Methylovulum sp.]|nr:hypothetical protein [Methylovulum sp.]